MPRPAWRDGAVVGLPDDKWGERVTAVVQLQPGAELDPAELVTFAKERIGSVKAPKQVEVWPDLPRSTVGKVLKREVRAALLRCSRVTSRAAQLDVRCPTAAPACRARRPRPAPSGAPGRSPRPCPPG